MQKRYPPLSSASNVGMKNILFWFDLHDLRLHDNYALKLACRHAWKVGGSVFPCFCFDIRKFASATPLCGFFSAHPRRAIFVQECIQDLRESFARRNQRMWIRYGHPEEAIPRLAKELECTDIYAHAAHTPEDLEVRSNLQAALKHQANLREVWGSTLVHIDDLDLPVSQFPVEFGKYHDFYYRARIRQTYAYDCRKTGALPVQIQSESFPDPGDIPSLSDLGYKTCDVIDDPRAVLSFHGGETAGCQRVTEFFERKIIDKYSPGFAEKERARLFKSCSSHLSPWITHGCVSPRKLHEMVRQYSIDHAGSRDWECKSFMIAILRRDYWHFLSKRFGATLRASAGPTPDACAVDPPKGGWRFDPSIITRWCSGRTGAPFVDAAMRELTLTGYSASQSRRSLLWFLTRGLQQDWRVAAEWFQRSLLDYDPHVCWGNCAYYSGLIFDIGSRMPIDSAERIHLQFDGAGVFTRLWLPELHNVPTTYLHRPQMMTKRMQQVHSVEIGKDYPLPIKLWYEKEKTLVSENELPSYINETNKSLLGEGIAFGLGKLKGNESLHMLT